MTDCVVIGGGLAGLTAANALAGAGKRVTVIEQASQLGGRARTQNESGYLLNLGPHAFYRGGTAARTFAEWKIPFTGAVPPTSGRAFFVRGGEMFPMLTGPASLLTTRLFGTREKLEAAGLLGALTSAKAAPGETMAQWIDRTATSPRVRELAATLTRISTFCTELEYLSAPVALAQIASGLKHGVLYLDGGWQMLVDGLAARARGLGVEFQCGEPVTSLDGISARKIVLACGPAQVTQLTGVPMPAGRPVRMASLDLGLRGMPAETPNVAFGLDRPLYLSVHSASARLAPEGGLMVHVAKYLGSANEDPKALRAELEEYATVVMPNWQRHVEFARFLPDLVVSPMMPAPMMASPQGRPTVRQTTVTIAGDWVGDEGMLTDAAVASALKAAA